MSTACSRTLKGIRLGALILAAALLAGCTQSSLAQLPVGPVGSRPENHDTVGTPARRGQAATVGQDGLFNGGAKPAVIDRRVIVSPRHIRLVGGYVTIGGSSETG
jgi:hypothetical protein